MHLYKWNVTAPGYLDLWEWGDKIDTKKTAIGKTAIPWMMFNNKELQPIATVYFQWTVNKTGRLLAVKYSETLSSLNLPCLENKGYPKVDFAVQESQ